LNQLRHPIDMVQAPYNLLDRRLFTSGWGHKLAERGVEIHVRSAFLQGLLLIPRAEVPAKFDPWEKLWRAWQSWLHASAIEPVQACLQFSLAQPEITKVVVGADSARQLQKLLQAEMQPRLVDVPAIATNDEKLINPANWATL
jgi:aryl-alcohol dehydrogenase-like predicted oxidoreductase